MKKYLLVILIAIFVSGSVYFVFKMYGGAKPMPVYAPESTTAVTTPQTAPAISAKIWTVEYKDNKFVPLELKIKKGDTVTWINKSSTPTWPASDFHPTHTAYDGTSLKEHCTNKNSTTFDSCGGVKAGASWSFTFNKVGSWEYHDHLNPSVGGVVEVTE